MHFYDTEKLNAVSVKHLYVKSINGFFGLGNNRGLAQKGRGKKSVFDRFFGHYSRNFHAKSEFFTATVVTRVADPDILVGSRSDFSKWSDPD